MLAFTMCYVARGKYKYVSVKASLMSRKLKVNHNVYNWLCIDNHLAILEELMLKTAKVIDINIEMSGKA